MSEEQQKPVEPARRQETVPGADGGEHLYPVLEATTAQQQQRSFVTNIFRLYW